MEKLDLPQQFALRLKEAMLAAGFHSGRSTSGVCIHKLKEITGNSVQICRKYLCGQAIPSPAKLAEMAQTLKVSPGWLLFGDKDEDMLSEKAVTIKKVLLYYILTNVSTLPYLDKIRKELPDFMMDLINDVSHIQATEEQSKKIVDLALSSIKHFQPLEENSI